MDPLDLHRITSTSLDRIKALLDTTTKPHQQHSRRAAYRKPLRKSHSFYWDSRQRRNAVSSLRYSNSSITNCRLPGPYNEGLLLVDEEEDVVMGCVSSGVASIQQVGDVCLDR